MKMKKIAMLAMGIIVGISSLTGCSGGKDEKPAQTGGTQQEAPDNKGEDKEAKLEGTGTKELKYLGPYGAFDPNTDPTAPLLEELTGYKVTYSMLPAEQANEKLNLEIAGEAQYNAIKVWRQQFDILSGKNMVLDLKPYLEEYGQNILSSISQESWDTVTVDGKILGIPEKNPNDCINAGVLVRKDILDQHGLEVPKTTEEFKQVSLALKDAGLNTPAAIDPAHSALMGSFGIPNEWNEVDGKLVYRGADPRFKEYLDWMKDLYANGTLGKDWETLNFATTRERFVNGDSAFMISGYWSAKSIYDAMAAQGVADPMAVVEYIPALEGPHGDAEIYRDKKIVYVTVIPRYMEKTAVDTIKWLNAKFEPDNFLKFALGDEGYHYTVEDGKYYPILEPNAEGTPKFDEKSNSNWYLTGSREEDYANYWLARARKSNENFHAWTELNKEQDKYGAFDPLGYAPNIESWTLNVQALSSVVSDFALPYIVGKESDYEGFQKQLQANQIDQVTADVNAWYTSK